MILVNDDFAAADGTALDGRAPSPISAGLWATFVGAAAQQTIVGNKARLNGQFAATQQSIVCDAGVADCTIAATMTGIATLLYYGMYFRVSDASNLWIVYATQTDKYLAKVVAGVATTVATAAVASTNDVDYPLSIVLLGNSISANIGGTLLTGTDAFNSGATIHGPLGGDRIVDVDNFIVTTP